MNDCIWAVIGRGLVIMLTLFAVLAFVLATVGSFTSDEKRLDNVEKRLDNVEKRLDNVEKRLDKLEKVSKEKPNEY